MGGKRPKQNTRTYYNRKVLHKHIHIRRHTHEERTRALLNPEEGGRRTEEAKENKWFEHMGITLEDDNASGTDGFVRKTCGRRLAWQIATNLYFEIF